MGFLQKREINTDTESGFLPLLGEYSTNGILVNEQAALNIPAIASSVDLIAGIISMLNFRLYKKVRCDKVEEVEQDKRLFLLNKEPNNLMNSSQLLKAMAQDILLHGNTYSNYDKKNIFYVENNKVSVMLDTNVIHKDAKLNIGGETFEIWEFIIATLNTKNGLTGEGVLKRNKELLALALLEQKYVNELYSNGGAKRGFFSTVNNNSSTGIKGNGKLSPEAFEKLKEDIKTIYKSGIPDYILNGITYTPIAGNNSEMQVLESRKFVNDEIEKIFHIPTDLETESKYKSLIKLAVTPIVTAIENAVNKTMLKEKEKKDGYYFQLDLDELTRASVKERFEAHKLALDSGIKSVNEVRAEENLESKEGLDIHKFSLGEVLFESGKFYVSNTGEQVNLSKVGGIGGKDSKVSQGNQDEDNAEVEE